MIRLSLLSLTVLALGCDPSAHAEGGARRGADYGQQLETCAAQRDCAQGLRCRNEVCWPAQTSAVGDYHAAVGARALADGDIATATASYNRAVSQYEADKLEPPVGLICDQGHALIAARDIPERAEQAARVLHSCVLGAPAGSGAYHRAMADLALLGNLGLEPLALASTDLANAYLTRQGTRPSADDLAVKVSSSPTPESKTYAGWAAKLQSDEVRDQLVPCWEAHWEQTREPEMKVTLAFRYRWHQGVYIDQDRAMLTIEDPPSTPAATCVEKILTPLADAYSKDASRGSWRADISITVGK